MTRRNLDRPSIGNGYLAEHVELLLRNYRERMGVDLIQPGDDLARRLFEAPFFVASHDTADDPVLTYGNLAALDLFEMDWEAFTSTPSRFTAEAPLREERARLLEQVSRRGSIEDYSGIRISSSGKRFLIRRATVWNLVDESGEIVGQAATFDAWEPIY